MGSPWGSHPMGIPWSGIGASHWGFHGKLLWLAHGNQPMGIPWNGIGTSHVGIPGKLLWLAHGNQPMGILWNGIGTSHVGIPGKLLWLAHGVPTQWAIHGMAVGMLMRCDSMDSFYG